MIGMAPTSTGEQDLLLDHAPDTTGALLLEIYRPNRREYTNELYRLYRRQLINLAFSSSAIETAAHEMQETPGSESEEVWFQCWERLEAVQHLDRDWDGAGAEPIRPEIIRTAFEWLSQREACGDSPPHKIVPSPDGSLILAWLTPRGMDQYEIEEPGTVLLLRADGTAEEIKVGRGVSY